MKAVKTEEKNHDITTQYTGDSTLKTQRSNATLAALCTIIRSAKSDSIFKFDSGYLAKMVTGIKFKDGVEVTQVNQVAA